MFRRPPRAAALKKCVQTVKPSMVLGTNGSSVQEDGKDAVLDCDSIAKSMDVIGKKDKEARSCREPISTKVLDSGKAPDSSYMRRQTEEVQVNRQPVGFDARLAAAVASRALGQQEEMFGGSDSESDSSSSSSSESADF